MFGLPASGGCKNSPFHLSSFDIFEHPNLPIKCHTLYLVSGRLDDAESELDEAGGGGRNPDDVDEQDQREDEAPVAAKENA